MSPRHDRNGRRPWMRAWSRRGALFAAALLTGAVGGMPLVAPAAHAAFTAARLVSSSPASASSPALQADYAYDPGISADGRYVAFTGSVASSPGIYRKDLQEGGKLELVAAGSLTGAPSISKEGRYVSFTTSDEPATGVPTKSGCTNVYVRDMDRPISDPAAFTLASARDGSSEALTYGGSNANDGSCPGGGAAAADRVALSADGRTVAFTLIGTSNLTNPTTPPNQIALRELDPKRTTLVSITAASLGTGKPVGVPEGATIASSTVYPNASLGGSSIPLPISGSTAAISADGKTVAWVGIDIPTQVPTAAHEPAPQGDAPATGFGPESYAEPLWRRIADGPSAPTRRVTGGDDPLSSGCPSACVGPLNLEWSPLSPNVGSVGPIYGSYVEPEGFSPHQPFYDLLDAITPQLSKDGRRVAFLSTAPDYGAEPNFGGGSASRGTANAFVADMSPGLNRGQALTRITEWASINFHDLPTTGPIREIAISPDGSRVAFTTQRVVFPLAPPALVTPPLSFIDPIAQLYEANLSAGTLALVSQGYDGQPANAGVESPAFSADGSTLVFASAASNLVYGAVNEGSDVFATSEIDSPPLAGQQLLGPPPSEPTIAPAWRISATVHSAPSGALLLEVTVPGAGSLSAEATPVLPVLNGARATTTRGRVKNGRSRSSAVVANARRTDARAARATTKTMLPGVVVLRLDPAARYASLVHSRYGLYATIELSFASPGHAPLRQQLAGSFHATATAHRAHRSSKHRKRTHSSSVAR
jgi:WD40-like Beta Propeller Repeat